MGGIISSPIPPKSKIFLNCLTACSPEAPDSLHYTNKAMHSNVDYNPKICNNVCGGQPWERFQLNESPKHMQNFMHVYYPGKPWWQASKKNEIEQLVLYITDGGEMDYHELVSVLFLLGGFQDVGRVDSCGAVG